MLPELPAYLSLSSFLGDAIPTSFSKEKCLGWMHLRVQRKQLKILEEKLTTL
jgi:hypothetical protein